MAGKEKGSKNNTHMKNSSINLRIYSDFTRQFNDDSKSNNTAQNNEGDNENSESKSKRKKTMTEESRGDTI
jgi:hypothetical protein